MFLGNLCLVLSFGLYNAPTTFQRVVLAIFVDLIHDCIEVYMDDFTVYGITYEEALQNLEKVLIICQQHNLSLIHEKCFMMMIEDVYLGHHVLEEGIKVDHNKIEFIKELPTPITQIDVRSILRHAGYYRSFIKNISKLATPFFIL